MTVLSDQHLAQIAAQSGIPADRINPASIDLSLGHEMQLATWTRPRLDAADDGYVTPDDTVQLMRDRARIKHDGHHPDAVRRLAADAASQLRRLTKPTLTTHDLRDYPDGFWLIPGEGALLHTEHVLHVPEDKSGLLLLKSSRGREFWQHAFSGWFDPGFKGQGVLEVYAPVIPINIKHQQLVAQLVLFDTHPVSVPYGAPGRISHYQHQMGARGSAHR